MHIIRNGKIIHKTLLIILVVTLLWWIPDFALEFAFPTYLEDAGKSYLEIGALISLAAVAGFLIDLPLGTLSDKLSRKKLMIAGLTLSILSAAFIFYYKNNLGLLASFLIWGVAFQIWRVPRDAIFASHTDNIERGEEYGLDIEVRYIGQTIGALLAGVILTYAGISGIVNFYAILLISCILILFLTLKETKHSHLKPAIDSITNPSTIISPIKELKQMGNAELILLTYAMLFMVWGQILLVYQPLLYGPDVLNIPPEYGGLLMACFSLPGIFLSYPAGKLADKHGRKLILTIGLTIMGASLTMFSITQPLIHLYIFALLTSVGWAISLPALNSLIIDQSYGHKKGIIAGLLNFFMDLGMILGPILGGILAQIYGIKSAFLAMGLIFLLSGILLHACGKNKTHQ
jgi:MFS family permease